ncbi:MAG: BON domain-containing protein [Acidobacteria bacterium]|nr:MAG: BON domain-containing protein [Acidobacteriota bacterium]
MSSATRSDAEVQRDVIDELKWEPRVNPSEVGVAVTDGIVTLSGWVDSYLKRWAAEDAALRVRGVRAVGTRLKCGCLPTTCGPTSTSPPMWLVRSNGTH